MLSKMVSGRNESQVSQKSLEIKQDDKFFTRIMSKDTSIANSSSRVYYGGASSSIPFVWESSPGTPKHMFSESSIPPLTPPPSYFSRSRSKSKSKFKQNTILPKFITTRKKTTHISPSSSMSSSTTTTSVYSNSNSSSSSFSSWSSSRTPLAVFGSRKRLCFSCSSSSIHDNEEEEKFDDVVEKDDRQGSCLGSSSARVHQIRVSEGWFSLKNLKSAFLTIVRHGST